MKNDAKGRFEASSDVKKQFDRLETGSDKYLKNVTQWFNNHSSCHLKVVKW